MQTLVLLTSLLHSAPVPTVPAPRAFIVIAGVSAYADKQIPPRPDAENDARALHELLSDPRRLGPGKDQIRLLLGKSATRRALLDSLEWLRGAREDDLVLFAFFGQGAAIDERGERVCYLAADSTAANRSRDAISAGDIEEIFSRLRSRRVCVILEVPFKGFRTKRSIAQPRLERQFHEFANGKEGAYEYHPLPGRLVLPREGRIAPDVWAGLRGEADTGDGVVTSADLARFLRKRFEEKAPRVHILEGNGPAFPLAFNPAVQRKKAEIARLPREEAEKYAQKVLELCAIVHEEHVLEPEIPRLLDLGIRGLYEQLREPVPEDILRRLGRLKALNAVDREELLADIRQRLGKRQDLAEGNDITWTMREMLTQFDRWSGCEREDIVCICRPQHFGVGLVLRKSAATDLLEVVTPLAGGPAHKSGVMAGDVISAITWPTRPNGDPLPEPDTEPVRGLSLRECITRLEGKSGTRVRVTIQRPAEHRPREIEMARGRVSYETAHGWRRKRDGTWDHWPDVQKKIGYVRISQFTQTTPEETRRAVQKLQNQGMKGLVLDLRFNPGGLLTSVKDVAGLFVKEGVVVSIRAAGGKSEVLSVELGKERFEQPLVVLINAETASGGEMLAACLQDHKRGTVIGERSRGKGGIQNVEFAIGRQMMLTSALLMRSNGKSWHGWQDGEGGVTPNAGCEVRLSRRDREELWDNLRNSENLLPPAAHFKDLQLEKGFAHLRR